MAQLGAEFDARAIEPASAFEVIPAGKYKVQIVDSDMRPTKNGEGQYLWLEMEILDGPFANRRLWDRLNIVNPSTQAVEIAQRQLSAICHATGKLSVSDSQELHGIALTVTVRILEAKGNYNARNEIRGYEAVGVGERRPTGAVKPQVPSGGLRQRQAPSSAEVGAAVDSARPWNKNRTAPQQKDEFEDDIPF